MTLTKEEQKESIFASIGRLSAILECTEFSKEGLYTEKDRQRAIDLLEKISREAIKSIK